MKRNRTTEQLRRYVCDAEAAAARSHSLWRPVNMAIAWVLKDAIRRRHSRQQVYSALMKMAGPKRRGEPVAHESFRAAARQVGNGTRKLTLI